MKNLNLHLIAMWACVCLLAIFMTPIYENPKYCMYVIMVAFMVTLAKR